MKFLFPSTIASFGSFIAPGAKVPNEMQQMPTTMYGVSKVACERLGEYCHPKRWVYNIAGIRINGEAPQASEIAAAVKQKIPGADITFKTNQKLTDTIRSFGILDDSVARSEWEWGSDYTYLNRVVEDFSKEVSTYPERIKSLELFGA